jgi:hypothetical protein
VTSAAVGLGGAFRTPAWMWRIGATATIGILIAGQ